MNKILKKRYKLIFFGLLTLVTLPSKAETKYYSSVNAKNAVIKTYTPEVPPKLSFKYINKFDISKSGSGNYSNNDATVVLPYANLTSKPTFPVLSSETDEVRIKFNTGGANYANQIRVIDSSNNTTLFIWYNLNKSFYVYNNLGNLSSQVVVGGGGNSTMEFRFNFITKSYSFLINNNVAYSGVYEFSFPEGVYSNVFDGSSSSSSLTFID